VALEPLFDVDRIIARDFEFVLLRFCDFRAKRYNQSMSALAKNKTRAKKQSTVDFLLATADRIAKEAPANELDKLPKDGGKNLDHYLYGAPKR
jgi:hypothetical protein